MTQRSVLDLKAFVPARNLALSRQFYLELGFTEKWGNDQACELRIDGFGFLMQNFFTDPTGVLWHIADRRTSSNQ